MFEMTSEGHSRSLVILPFDTPRFYYEFLIACIYLHIAICIHHINRVNCRYGLALCDGDSTRKLGT